jgi:hypothetical protein
MDNMYFDRYDYYCAPSSYVVPEAILTFHY